MYGCQTITQNIPDIFVPAHQPQVNQVLDVDAFYFNDDFFLAPDYLPERRLALVPPEDRIAAMLVPLNKTTPDRKPVYAFPIVRNRQVDHYLRYYQSSGRAHLKASLEKSGAYLPYITQVLKREKIPAELAYLALLESNFNVHAYSRNHAAGMWQFIRTTAQRCGLRVDQWIDERLDFEKSTQAAACYLKRLYREFGSWDLVVAAYNAGEAPIKNALCRNRGKKFWDINKRTPFNCETVNLVSQLMATIIIAREPSAYGFTNLKYHKPRAYDSVTIAEATSLQRIAQNCGSSLRELQQLNPSLKKDFTPPAYPDFQVYIPRGTKKIYVAARAEDTKTKHTAHNKHIIKKGETLNQTAQRYKSPSPHALLAFNKIPNPQTITGGAVMLVPASSEAAHHDDSTVKKISYASESLASATIVCRVKAGDTLWSIARAYHVRPEQVKQWNKLKGNTIHPGMKLKLLVKKEKML
jgi:membrane-bound lytic murein transglycosylase D